MSSDPTFIKLVRTVWSREEREGVLQVVWQWILGGQDVLVGADLGKTAASRAQAVQASCDGTG